MNPKRIGLKLTAFVLTAAMAMQLPLQSLQAAAATKTEYLSEVVISYGKNDDEAKNWLTSNGYKVVNQNLNEGGEGGSDALSWMGLSSEKRSVFLGYKTTTDSAEAITDMKIMNMNGGYDYQAYEKVLDEMKQEKENFLHDITAALNEYRANYKAGKTKAKIAHDNLNKFKDDDSGQLMGDLLLSTIKTEDEAAWEKEPTKHADMVTIMMQGNSTCVSEIMQNLAFAADTADDSWLNRAVAAGSQEDDKSNFDVFFAQFQEDHPGWNKDDALRNMMALYDDDAKMFASSLIGLRNYLSNYTQSGLSADATPQEADAYFAEHEFEHEGTWAGAAALYQVLQSTEYGNDTLATYLVYNDQDYLEGYDSFQLPQRAALYPLIAEMSEGQRCLLEYTAMDRMVTMGLMDDATWSSTYATMNDAECGVGDLEACSVFAEVNRDDFKVGNVAVTNVAQGKAASLGESIDDGVFGTGVSYVTAGLFIGGLVTSIGGLAIAAKNWSSGAGKAAIEGMQDAANSGKSLYTGLVTNYEGIANPAGSATAMKLIKKQTLQDFTKEIMHRDVEGIGFFVKDYGRRLQLNDPKTANTLMKYGLKNQSFTLTAPGPDGDIAINAGFKVNYDGDKVSSVTDFTGIIYYPDGKTGVDQKIRDQYTSFMQEINPDFKDRLKQADDQINNLANAVGQNVDEGLEAARTALSELKTTIIMSEQNTYIWEDFLKANNMQATTLDHLTDEQFDSFVNYMQTNYPDKSVTEKLKDFKDKGYKKLIDADKAKDNVKKVADKMDDIIGEGDEAQILIEDKADEVMTSGSGSSFWKWFGVGMAIVGLATSAYSAYAAVAEMQEYYHMDMIPIPRKMVDLGYYEDGSTCYIYYDCTKCNRAAVGMANETLGDYGDLNGDVMKQWLALYTTKDTRAGGPITAKFSKVVGKDSTPMGYTPLSFFGFEYAVNMTDTRFTYNDNKQGIYLYYKQNGGANYTATVTTDQSLVLTGVLSALGGAGLCGAFFALRDKKKKKETADVTTG